MNTQQLYDKLKQFSSTDRMPAMFIGHGSPMNAIVKNKFNRTWREIGSQLPKPKAILSISAHWLTPGETRVTAMESPATIHDFYGFPEELYHQYYNAPGSPQFANKTIEIVRKAHLKKDYEWGLDHGTWSVLIQMFPEADIPVYQLSLDYSRPPEEHFEMAKDLQSLRDRGVLIIGSGNMVHNLQKMRMNAQPFNWAVEFDNKITGYISDRNFNQAVNFKNLGNLSKLAHPTHDHYLPLIYILAIADERSQIMYFNEDFDLSSISMKSFIVL